MLSYKLEPFTIKKNRRMNIGVQLSCFYHHTDLILKCKMAGYLVELPWQSTEESFQKQQLLPTDQGARPMFIRTSLNKQGQDAGDRRKIWRPE